MGPIILEAPITKSTQIHSFDEAPSPETEPVILAQLIDEIQTKAQRLLTEHLARQEKFLVVPFDETRRILADIAPSGRPFTAAQVQALGRQTGADIVLTSVIHDYGYVRRQYWMTGWLLHASFWTTVIGLSTAWNPAAIGGYLAFDATTDFPLWWGGAQVFGWTFRPVRVHLDAVQLTQCDGPIWTEEELMVKVPAKTLAEYSPEEQNRKEIQLEANLSRAMAEMAETAGEQLHLRPCTEEGPPARIRTFSILSLLDFLL